MPGTPAAWEYLLKHYGTLNLSQALSYGVRVATNGFVVDKTFYDQTAGNQIYFDDIPSSAAIYLDAGRHAARRRHDRQEPGHGAALPAHRPLGDQGGFYTGPVAEAIVKAVTQVPTGRDQRPHLEARPDDHAGSRELPRQDRAIP